MEGVLQGQQHAQDALLDADELAGRQVAHADLAANVNIFNPLMQPMLESGSRYDIAVPGYKANLSQQPEFVAWPEDPWTGASYSCFAPGEVCRAGPLYAEGFRKRMCFAGEHTCFAYMGYMEGALQSGQRAARSIHRAIARPRK